METTRQNGGNAEQPSLPWAEAVLASPLWRDAESPWRAVARDLAALCFSACSSADGNPWRDLRTGDWAIVCAAQLAQGFRLSAREVALLLTAPLLRLAAQSQAEVRAYGVMGLAGGEAEKAWALVWQQQNDRHPQWSRKRTRLLNSAAKADQDDAHALTFWMVAKAVSRRLEAWRAERDDGLLPDAFVEGIGQGAMQSGESLFACLEHPFVLARAAGLEQADLSADARRYPAYVAVPGGSDVVRVKLVATLAALAQGMTLDPLLMNDVVADHLALREGISAEELRKSLYSQGLMWGEPGLTLRKACDHPAVDMALCDLVAGLEQRRAEAINADTVAEDDIPPFLDHGIRPARDERGEERYLPRPHIHFTLSNDDVRELLMGERLYGDPALAIRELYQNALDACRYREAREAYRKASGQGGDDPPWLGEITLTHRADASGRAYLECSDNGVGMSMRHLRNCFAKAGRRFANAEDYLEETVAWKGCGIEHFPNSQFGVGVFSYFMLAEEISITTRRHPLPGEADETFQVAISGAGSLFRLRRAAEQRPCYGTTVRLYLSHGPTTGPNSLSLREKVQEFLWVADYATTVSDFDERTLTFQPGQLPERLAPHAVAVVNDRDCQAWWSKDFVLLADGVVIKEKKWRALDGVIVNLRNGLRPKLTVDRKTALSWDWKSVQRKVEQADCETLDVASQFWLGWIWEVSRSFPWLVARWAEKIKNSESDAYSYRFDDLNLNLAEIGISSVDSDIFMVYDRSKWDDEFDIEHWMAEIEAGFVHDIRVSQLRKYIDNFLPEWHFSDPDLLVHDLDIDLIDGRLLSQHLSGCGQPIERGVVSPLRVLAAQYLFGLPVEDAIERLKKYEAIGIYLRPGVERALRDFPPISRRDKLLLTQDLYGAHWADETPLSPIHFIAVSAFYRVAPSDCVARFKDFQSLGVEIPGPLPDDLDAFANPPAIDLKLLSRDLGGDFPWLASGPVNPEHIVGASHDLDLSVSEVLERLKKYRPFGITIEDSFADDTVD